MVHAIGIRAISTNMKEGWRATGGEGVALLVRPAHAGRTSTSRAEALEARRGDTGRVEELLARRRFGSTFVAGQRWKR